MSLRLKGRDYSLHTPIYNNEGSDTTLLEYIAEARANQEVIFAQSQESNLQRVMFKQAMSMLNERERDILTARRLQEHPATLEELSKLHNISRERVRQIETRTMEKIKEHVNMQLADA